MDSKPEDLDRLERRLIQLKLEQKALEKDDDEASIQRLAVISKQITEHQKI
jgi:ATP-dependent Clp protease ATP-binding subunit ClpB